MRGKGLIRMWWLSVAALLGMVGAASPTRASSNVGFTIPGCATPNDVDARYLDGYFASIGDGWEVGFFGPNGASRYYQQFYNGTLDSIWQDTKSAIRDEAWSQITTGLDPDSLELWAADVLTKIDIKLLSKDAVGLSILTAETLASLDRNGIVGVLTYDRVPISAAPAWLRPDLTPRSGLPVSSIGLTTAHGCGGQFTTNESVVVYVEFPFHGLAWVTMEPLYGGAPQVLANHLTVSPNQPVPIALRPDQVKIGQWHLRLYPSTQEGLSLNEQDCNFSVVEDDSPPPPSGTGGGGGTGAGGGGGGGRPIVALVDGRMYRENSRPEVYLSVNGGLLWVQDDPSNWGGWDNVTVVPDGALQVGHGGRLPRDGTVVKEKNNNQVWVIRNQQRCWISNPDQVNWSAVRTVPDGSLEFFSRGPDEPIVFKNGHMYRDESRPEVYLSVNGGLLWVQDDPNNWGGWDHVTVIGAGGLRVPHGGILPNDGTLLKEKNSNQVWLVRNRQLHWIRTIAQLNANGGWSAVRTVPDGSLSFFPQGADIG